MQVASASIGKLLRICTISRVHAVPQFREVGTSAVVAPEQD